MIFHEKFASNFWEFDWWAWLWGGYYVYIDRYKEGVGIGTTLENSGPHTVR